MMSNPPSSLQYRQRLHQRQHSTPVIAFEAMKLSNMHPAMMTPQQQQRQNFHRRGQSFDQQQRSPIRRHNRQGSTVSIANIGSTTQGQQILREAQQQRIARPGQQSLQFHQHQQSIDMQFSPQCGIFPTNTSSMPQTSYDNLTMNAIMQNASEMQIAHSPYFDIPVQMNANFHPMPLVDENSHQFFQDISLMDQNFSFDQPRASQPDLRIQTHFRPHTPTQQIQTAQFPLTPPFSTNVQRIQSSRSLHNSPAIQSPFPVPMQRGRSLQGIIEHEESIQVPNSQGQNNSDVQNEAFESAEMPLPETFAPALSPTNLSEDEEEPSKDENSMLFFDETGGEMPELKKRPVPILTSSRAHDSQSPSRPALSPRRLSISDLHLEPGISASIEETNVTLDDIAQYIDGPDAKDNKWVCKFEDCNKRFGRKENIKSHVQTHLGDRQFRCDHCHKCFVRGHDLKRHAKIHTGNKPYPCLCGNAFARHDALTRHRQRGMCIGAFEGVVKKTMKRGRPRKHRPEMDERMEKSSRTRAGVDNGDQYTSSSSSYTGSSWGSPPTETYDSLSVRGNSPFDDMGLFGTSQPALHIDAVSFPPELFSFTPPASPGFSTGNKPSPPGGVLTPTDLGEAEDLIDSVNDMSCQHIGSFMANPMVLQHSQHSLPSLSHSGSSPAAEVIGFDFSDLSTSMIRQAPLKMDSERNDFDNFLDYGGMEMGLESLDSDSFFNNL